MREPYGFPALNPLSGESEHRFRARRLRDAAARHALWAERLLALAERAEAGDDFLARIRHAKTEHKRGLKS